MEHESEIFSETTLSGAHVHSETTMQITEDAICTKFHTVHGDSVDERFIAG